MLCCVSKLHAKVSVLYTVCLCSKGCSLSDVQFMYGCTFALRVQAWVSGGISQRSASEAEASGGEKSLTSYEHGWGTATCEE